MIKTYRPKRSDIKAVRLTEDNFREVEDFCRGATKGMRLPIRERIINFHDGRNEQTIEVGDWVVREAPRMYVVYSDERFNEVYEESK